VPLKHDNHPPTPKPNPTSNPETPQQKNRAADDVVAVAKLCARLSVPHIINNAYGVQSASACALITAAMRRGRVDAVVQSTDKNFMVPVGGALVAAPLNNPWLAVAVAQAYPGRASSAPLVDLLVTLLHWGAGGWRRVLREREGLYAYLRAALERAAAEVGERVLVTPGNSISLAVTLDGLFGAGGGGGGDGDGAAVGDGDGDGGAAAGDGVAAAGDEGAARSTSPATPTEDRQQQEEARGPQQPKPQQPLDVTYFGAMLWSRGISGTRVVAPGKPQTVGGLRFDDYGSHCDGGYPHVYLTAAAAVGTTEGEVDEFCARLVKAYREFKKKKRVVLEGAAGSASAAL